MNALAYNQADAIQLLQPFKSVFVTTLSGLSYPKADRTWRHAINYVRSLIRLGDKMVTDINKYVNTNHKSLERFIRESLWEHEQIHEHLHEQVPEKLPAEETRSLWTVWRFRNDPSVASASLASGVTSVGRWTTARLSSTAYSPGQTNS